MAETLQLDSVPKLLAFRVERSDLSIQAAFGNQFWPLFHNVPALYSALLGSLRDFGITAEGIKSDVGDGSLGAYNVNFWLLGFRLLVRIRLERVEIRADNLTLGEVDRVESAVIEILKCLVAADPTLVIDRYTVDLGSHGAVAGAETSAYLKGFLSAEPRFTTPLIGCGIVFYFGADSTASVRSVTVDLSGVLPGKLYLRVFSIYTASVQPSGIRKALEDDIRGGYAAVGLTGGVE